jgi:hypothetical protein
VFLLYADEFGHDGRWDPSNPRFAHHPLFGLAGFAILAEHWRDLDRGYFRLKSSFYAHEMARARTKGVRPERYEMKDLTSRRDVRFTYAVLQLLEALKAHVFVLSSAQSYLFSANADITGGFSRLIEVPLLVRSDWHHAVQAADTVARAVGRIYRYRTLGDANYQKLDTEVGSQFNKLEARYGNWTSMYVK